MGMRGMLIHIKWKKWVEDEVDGKQVNAIEKERNLCNVIEI